MSDEATQTMLTVLGRQPAEYIGNFMADFGGDPEDYLDIPSPDYVFDFSTITDAEVGLAFSRYVERWPPTSPALPDGFDLADVDWVVVAPLLESILMGAADFGP